MTGFLRTDIPAVCKNDDSCAGFPVSREIKDMLKEMKGLSSNESDDEDEGTVANMTCYKGGQTVFNNHQMCDVTSTYFSLLPGLHY